MIRLQGGKVYDPSNDIDGEIRDIWIDGNKIVRAPSDPQNHSTIDLSGLVVMPGGIDMHCHIAGPKVNIARKMQPELLDRQVNSVPDIVTTGQKYIGLGYTTCFDAAITPLAARHVHHEFSDLPFVDAGFFALTGNNHLLLQSIAAGDESRTEAALGWLLDKTGAYAPKIVNPGGVELWKKKRTGNATDIDQTIDGFSVTPRQIIDGIARAANRLGLPHPVHVHSNNLGIPGNWTTTLETMKTLAGQRAHLTHIQFHSYGQGSEHEKDAESVLTSRVRELVDFVNQHPELSVDVGQVLFGKTTSMTGDGPLGYFLHQVNGEKWYSADTELESGCGISPIEYKHRNYVHAMQWAIGLEWYLLTSNPWQVVLSTDSPNGASFQAYPHLIRLLMDRDFRREQVERLPKRAQLNSCLRELDREYTLFEIAIITRAGPAKLLGLKDKGHLGFGADADITVYSPDKNFETMFSVPRWVFKSGQAVVRDHEVTANAGDATRILSHSPTYDRDRDHEFAQWFDAHYSIRASHFGVDRGHSSEVS